MQLGQPHGVQADRVGEVATEAIRVKDGLNLPKGMRLMGLHCFG